ncbi:MULTISPECIES: DOPA 4,5-dioxygenase family protein [unclassified Achromobacter]|uniref:DOPA 4,5-dioxygenase family protein n=1 Tax=unclassified Achromobacter TaxID=2626865 RepID=UPI000B515835|nr:MULTISPECIES: DOPA 4,5-dioxygenase family protein [unclassified Achromobacter]OWT80850.1 aromatic ring-cleaving dioxygenase [Achromobacter sp. HZ34]OWT81366.1 aromatic ring-cleaving dioxygenase [Achromobacter sp. HZ28]
MDKNLAATPAAAAQDRAVQTLDTIRSYHAHIYFENQAQRQAAEALREEIAQRFPVLLGRWHDTLVGPHARPMYQVAFAPAEFARFVPWLLINRRGLVVLVHPNTGRPRTDHLEHALWMGEVLEIHNPQRLPDAAGPEPAIEPNTQPTVAP